MKRLATEHDGPDVGRQFVERRNSVITEGTGDERHAVWAGVASIRRLSTSTTSPPALKVMKSSNTDKSKLIDVEPA